MRQSPLTFSAFLIACCPSFAEDNFVVFPFGLGKTITYDLRTVQMIQPGRFTIVRTLIDDGDAMALELKVLNALRIYCTHDVGQYPAPTDLFTLGPPDLPVRNIQVESRGQYHVASWEYPYKRMAADDQGGFATRRGWLSCKGTPEDERRYQDRRAEIMNGEQSKELFDCKRGLRGAYEVTPTSLGEQFYSGVCLKVTHEKPYRPNGD